jgi:hypothetical protein
MKGQNKPTGRPKQPTGRPKKPSTKQGQVYVDRRAKHNRKKAQQKKNLVSGLKGFKFV